MPRQAWSGRHVTLSQCLIRGFRSDRIEPDEASAPSPAKAEPERQMTTDRTKAEIAACVAEILTALARMARDQQLTELHMMIETATKQAQYEATKESKKSSRKRSAA